MAAENTGNSQTCGGNEMTKGNRLALSILITFLMAAFAGSMLAGENITIVGVVTDDGLIVDKSGVIYEIGENDNFDAVSEQAEVRVEATGRVEVDEGGNKIIMIDSFKVLE
jgi:hypothetical protein